MAKYNFGHSCRSTIEEVLDLLAEPFKRGLLLNIELKNGFFAYGGMEEMIVKLIDERGLNDNIVYSSFSAKSIALIRQLNPKACTGLLGGAVSDLYWKYRHVCGADALHPIIDGMDVEPRLLRESGMPIRAWMRAPLFSERITRLGGASGKENSITKAGDAGVPIADIAGLKAKGVTDLFVNEPEKYLSSADL